MENQKISLSEIGMLRDLTIRFTYLFLGLQNRKAIQDRKQTKKTERNREWLEICRLHVKSFRKKRKLQKRNEKILLPSTWFMMRDLLRNDKSRHFTFLPSSGCETWYKHKNRADFRSEKCCNYVAFSSHLHLYHSHTLRQARQEDEQQIVISKPLSTLSVNQSQVINVLKMVWAPIRQCANLSSWKIYEPLKLNLFLMNFHYI